MNPSSRKNPIDIEGHLLSFGIWTQKTYVKHHSPQEVYDWMSRGRESLFQWNSVKGRLRSFFDASGLGRSILKNKHSSSDQNRGERHSTLRISDWTLQQRGVEPLFFFFLFQSSGNFQTKPTLEHNICPRQWPTLRKRVIWTSPKHQRCWRGGVRWGEEGGIEVNMTFRKDTTLESMPLLLHDVIICCFFKFKVTLFYGFVAW